MWFIYVLATIGAATVLCTAGVVLIVIAEEHKWKKEEKENQTNGRH